MAWQWIRRDDPIDIVGMEIASYEERNPGTLPDVRDSAKLCAVIDWSGQYSASRFSSLAILLADERGCETWYQLREQVRRKYLPDGRRMSYKDLSDGVRWDALLPFLVAADEIPGLLFTVLVDRTIPALTGERLPPKVGFADAVFGREDYRRLELTAQFLGILLAGLSDPGQKGQLIFDEDNIIANESQREAVCTALRLVINDRLPHALGAWTVSSPPFVSNREVAEDLLAVADLAAGALADVASSELAEARLGFVPSNPALLKAKTVPIVAWLGLGERPLRRLALIIRQGDGESYVTAQVLSFGMGSLIPGLE